MEPGEAAAESGEFLLIQQPLGAGKDLVFFKADVVVEQSRPFCGTLLDRLSSRHGRLQVCNLRANERMFSQ